MNEVLLNKLKQAIEQCSNPNAEDIDIKLDYSDLVHLFSLEKANAVYMSTMEEQLQESFGKIK